MGSALAGAATLAGRGLLGLVQLDVNHCRRLAKEDDSHQDATLSFCKPPHSALTLLEWEGTVYLAPFSPYLHLPTSPKLSTQRDTRAVT